MNPRYSLAIHTRKKKQSGSEDSFVGGLPKLPKKVQLPVCSLCGAGQTFYMQVAFPDDHDWAGHSLAIFACTECADKKYLIPEMLTVRLKDAEPSSSYLASYQRNFRFLVFETKDAVVRDEYEERVLFKALAFPRNSINSIGLLGGSPVWLMGDESPKSSGMPGQAVFLFQLFLRSEFETVHGAPVQMDIGLEGTPEPSLYDYYELFIGNALYLFGPPTPVQDHVYALTQVE